MECKEAESLIPQYLKDTMDKDTLMEFISHIRECRSCYNELDTFFMIDRSIETLEQEDKQNYDFSHMLDQDLNRRWQMIARNDTSRQLTVFYAIVVLICVVWIILDMYGIVSLSYLL